MSTDSIKSPGQQNKMAQKQQQLPEKLHNRLTLKSAEQVSVQLNAYRIDVSNIAEVHKYELRFFGTNKKNEEKDLSKGKKTDVSIETRHNLHWELFQQLLLYNKDFFQIKSKEDLKGVVYDRGINFYHLKALLGLNKRKQFEMTKEGLSDESVSYLGSLTDLKATLLYTNKLSLRGSALTEEQDHSRAQFIDILTNQEVYHKSLYLVFTSKMFEKGTTIPLDNVPIVMKPGLEKNVQSVGDDLKNAMTILQIDAKKTSFFPDVLVYGFAADFLSIDDPNDVWKRNNFQRLADQLKNLVVVPIFMREGKAHSFQITGLTEDSAKEKTFKFEGSKITIAKYFQQQYQIHLKYPQLPCAIRRMVISEGVKEGYYPLELLQILPGQRVKLQKQTPKLTEQMIRKCQTLPVDLKKNIEQQKVNVNIQNNNAYLKAFGVRIEEGIKARAQVLHPPAITYNENEMKRVEPNQRGEFPDRWMLTHNDSKKFTQPCQLAAGDWAAVIMLRGVNPQDCMSFLRAFVNNAASRGVIVQPTDLLEFCDDIRAEILHKMFNYFQEKKVRFVLFFSKDKIDHMTHHGMKLMEIQYKICTQHVTAPVMKKAIGPNGAHMVLSNILMKFNLKNGGLNHGLTAGQVFMQKNSCENKAKQWFAAGRMFFGLDMSHAAPQSLFEREMAKAGKGKAGDPTVVGMAYTIDHQPGNQRGTYWMQETRVTTIKYLSDHVYQALQKYSEHNAGTFPQNIVVYRGGVSEGEYQRVAKEEVQGFVGAFDRLASGSANFKRPTLTIVVCQRGSNYRIIPEHINPNAKAPQQNCRPGTVVDRAVMHPTLTEFLLMGHTTIQGTGQPVRCTVVYDDASDRLLLEELEHMTYWWCYAHGIVTSPVSVPAILYSAADLAKRGRNNYKTSVEMDPKFGQMLAAQNEEGYHQVLSQNLASTIDKKFWA